MGWSANNILQAQKPPPFTTCVYCTCIHVLDQAQLVFVSMACHESTWKVRAGISEPQDRGRHYTASHKLQKRDPFTTCVHCIYMHLLNKARLICSSMACHRTTGSVPSATRRPKQHVQISWNAHIANSVVALLACGLQMFESDLWGA